MLPVRPARWPLVRSPPTRRVPPHQAGAVFVLRGQALPMWRRVVPTLSVSVSRQAPRPSRTALYRSLPGRLHWLQPQGPQLVQML